MRCSISKIISAIICLSLCFACFCGIPVSADAPVNVLVGKIATCTAGRSTGTLSNLTDGKYSYNSANASCTYAHVTYGDKDTDTLAAHSAYFEYSFDVATCLNSVKLYYCNVETNQLARDIAIDVQLEDGTWQRVAADYDMKWNGTNNSGGTGGNFYEGGSPTYCYLQYKFAPVDCMKLRITSNRKRMRINKGLTGSTCVFRLAEIQAFYDPGITTYSGVERPDQADYAVPVPTLTNYALSGTVTSKGTPHASNGLANLHDGNLTNRAMSYYYNGTTTPTDTQCVNYYDITFADTKEIDRVDVVYSKYADDDRGHREQDIAVDIITTDGRYVRVAEKHDFTAAAEAANGSNYTLSMTFDPVEADGVRISANCKQTTRYTAGTYSNILQGYAEIEVYNDPNVVSNTGIESATVEGTAIPHFSPVFMSHSLVLAERIGVNFFMDLSSLTAEQKAGSYMTFAVKNESHQLRADYDGAFTNSTGAYHGFTCQLSSVQMAESITPTLHYTLFGVEKSVVGEAYSVKNYMDYVVENSGSFDSTVIDLVKALGDYGHYMQIYLGNKNGWTAGTQYTALAKYRAADFTSDNHTAYLNELNNISVAMTKNIESTAVTNVSYNLNFDSTTYVNVKMTTTDSITASAVVSGVTVNTSGSGQVQFRTQGLPILKLGDAFTVIGSGSQNTNTFTITLSGLSYIRAILNSGTSSTMAKDAMSALYGYYRSACVYQTMMSDGNNNYLNGESAEE